MLDPSQPAWIAIVFLIPLLPLTSLQLRCEPAGLRLLVSIFVLRISEGVNGAVPAVDRFRDHDSINA